MGDYVTKCNLTIMDLNITWLAKKVNENFGRLMHVLWGENNVQCIIKYSYVGIIVCSNKSYDYF
jgi:hypothetical protein